MLRSRYVAIVLILALLFCTFALPAGAAGIDYNDYVTDVVVDGGNDLVTVRIPASLAYMRIYDYTDKTELYEGYGGTHSIDAFIPYHEYGFQLYPFGYPWGSEGGLDQSLIPDGTSITVDFDMNVNVIDELPMEASFYILYRDSNGVSVGSAEVVYEYNGTKKTFNTNITAPDNASLIQYENDIYFVPDTSEGSFVIRNTVLTMSISSLLRQQQLTGKTNAILTEVEKQLEANGQTLQEVLQQQQQTNDKLDKLPGQIGDEMQGVIENEKEESKNEGNQFVDQILDALPDPSQDVLAALKGLTDATAYTGTDAVLPIPAIVLPGIDGLFPETEIWGGTEFDFGEYIGMLHPTLLTLVQALFTIAIVLYCVYELKGIISYCLTLRESKGG